MPKTTAERVREYRARKKLLKQKRPAKTAAQCSREYRARKKALRIAATIGDNEILSTSSFAVQVTDTPHLKQKMPAKTAAQSCREYRARKKALKIATIGDNEILSTSSSGLQVTDTPHPSTSRGEGADMPKTNADYVREYRARIKLLKQKLPAKTAAQRNREYRARKKALTIAATIGDNEIPSTSTSGLQVTDTPHPSTSRGNGSILYNYLSQARGEVQTTRPRKSCAQRCREYRERKKARQNAENIVSPVASVSSKYETQVQVLQSEVIEVECDFPATSDAENIVAQRPVVSPVASVSSRATDIQIDSLQVLESKVIDVDCDAPATSDVRRQSISTDIPIDVDEENAYTVYCRNLIQTRNPPKSCAQRNREYRARKKAMKDAANFVAQRQRVSPIANVSSNATDIVIDSLQVLQSEVIEVKCDSSATSDVDEQNTYSAYRILVQPRKPTKSCAQRSREYRARKKAMKDAANIFAQRQKVSPVAKVSSNATDIQIGPVQVLKSEAMEVECDATSDIRRQLTSTDIPIDVNEQNTYSAYRQAHQEFMNKFTKNPFGDVCTICNRVWFKEDLKQPVEAHHEILHTILPDTSVENILACNTCFSSLNKKKIPVMSAYNGFKFPDVPDHLPPLEISERSKLSPRIPFMQIRRLRHVNGVESQDSVESEDDSYLANVNDIGTDTDPIADAPQLVNVGEIPCIKTEKDDPDFVDPAQFSDYPPVQIKVEVPEDELYEPKYIPDIDTEESKFDPLCLDEVSK
ncbi:uncharacterized protein LOC115885636 isoform X2 [Sitophilus oryzae]|uniref:Uncharacterized protein LOC115885636 isoform X2 n=1 Tax=Sitophilus oryzae TaxID=7048 RepID=A0A6J2YB64_SITOR|nr:uncharacterized protein LOC115885636 isoform X2 [Sitophilus oryzae]